MDCKKFFSYLGFGEPELPYVSAVIDREIHQSRLQLLEAQAAAERYTATVYMLEERIERLMHQRVDIEAMHRGGDGIDGHPEEIVVAAPKARRSMQ